MARADMAAGNVDDAMVQFALGGVTGVIGLISGGAGLIKNLRSLHLDALPKVGKAVSGVGGIFSSLGKVLMGNPIILICTAIALVAILIITNWDAVRPFFEAIWNAIKGIFEAAFNFIKPLVDVVWNGIKVVIETVMNIIKAIIEAVWNAIKVYIEIVMAIIKFLIIDPLTQAWNGIQVIMNAIRAVFEAVWNAIVGVINAAMSIIQDYIITPMTKVRQTVIGILEGIYNVFRTIFDSIKGVVQSAIDFIMGLIQPVIDLVNGLGDAVGSLIPEGDIIPGLHLFADGGYVTRPTLAMIGEGGEGEYVIPESKMSKFFGSVNVGGGRGGGVTIGQITVVSSDPSLAGRALVKELGYRGVKL